MLLVFLSAQCPTPISCWHPGTPPWWVWLIYAGIVVASGLVIFGAEGGRPSRRALGVWLAAMVLVAISAEAIELYVTAAAAAK